MLGVSEKAPSVAARASGSSFYFAMRILPQAQREPGVKEFQIHQNTARPNEFFFYEVFAGDAAFAEHQQTRHFKDIIVGQAIPKLARREREQFRFI